LQAWQVTNRIFCSCLKIKIELLLRDQIFRTHRSLRSSDHVRRAEVSLPFERQDGFDKIKMRRMRVGCERGTTKSLKKLLACIGAYYVLQTIAGLTGGVVYAFYTTPLDLAPWLHLLQRLL